MPINLLCMHDSFYVDKFRVACETCRRGLNYAYDLGIPGVSFYYLISDAHGSGKEVMNYF
jgi:hypothetical protein